MTGFQMKWLLFALVLCGCCGQLNGDNVENHPPQDPSAESAKSSAGHQASAPVAIPPESGAPTESALSTTRTWSFDEGSLGQLPAGLVSVVGRWAVTNDEAAPSGSRVLAQLATSADDVFNVALVTGASYRDVDISVRLRSVSGRVDQGGGIVWRARDTRNYYIARYNPLEDNFRVYKVANGRRWMLKSATLRIDHTAWRTLRIVMRGDHVECYLDGTKYLDVRDATFSDSGQIGLWTKADAQTHFDDFTVSAASPSEKER